MDKLKMESSNLIEKNIEKIGEIFPEVITEIKGNDGTLKKEINFRILKELLGSYSDDQVENYEFTWPGKREALAIANKPIKSTLRPQMEKSVNWDKTENLYIEGDNLDVLKLLQESYLGRIKMIYIDPPYNTGNDFIYNDRYKSNVLSFERKASIISDESDRMIKNLDSNGRFHSDWCSMMYSRLLLSRNLLTDDGLIFISIDDHEVSNLKNLCDSIFGESNLLSLFVWKRRLSSSLSSSNYSVDHEYVLVYRKSEDGDLNGVSKSYNNYKNPDNDPRGPWVTGDLTVGMNADQRPNQAYDLVDPKTGKVYPFNPDRVWAFIPESMDKLIKDNRVIFPKDTTKRPMQKRFKSELKKGIDPFSTFMVDGIGLNQEATRELKELFGGNYFNYAKPLSLIRTLIEQGTSEGDIVLDFFSGSSTTANAVMKQNSIDGKNRKFIMVQIPELISTDSAAYKAGFKTICDLGIERIRRSGNELRNKVKGHELDIGFRVFKLDSSNMKDIYYSPEAIVQNRLFMTESNIKEDRTDLDLLFSCLLEWGLELSKPYYSDEIFGVTVHTYDENALVACFADDVPEEVIREIAKRQPLRAVFRDNSFPNDAARVNVGEIFKLLSPDTDVKVL